MSADINEQLPKFKLTNSKKKSLKKKLLKQPKNIYANQQFDLTQPPADRGGRDLPILENRERTDYRKNREDYLVETTN